MKLAYFGSLLVASLAVMSQNQVAAVEIAAAEDLFEQEYELAEVEGKDDDKKKGGV